MNYQILPSIFLFNLLNYRLSHTDSISKQNKIILYLISEQREEIYHNSALCILHSALKKLSPKERQLFYLFDKLLNRQRAPAVILDRFDDIESCGFEGVGDLLCSLGDDTGSKEG